MMLFRFLQEKDVFEKYYKQHLAKRLLGGRGAADDAERGLLVKLKTECGYQFTSKLESMFTDIKTSRDLGAEWKRARAATRLRAPTRATSSAAVVADDVELAVQVLTTGSWPAPACAPCALPPALAASCDAFEAFYLAKHGGRRLAWQTAMGHADVRATFSGGRRHELNVSTHQMVVLLLFNDADVLPYADVAARTGIAGPELKRALQSMACVKVRQEWMVWGRGVGWVGVMDGWGEVDGWGREDGGWCVGWGG